MADSDPKRCIKHESTSDLVKIPYYLDFFGKGCISRSESKILYDYDSYAEK